jgi:hypothetical protein
MKRQATVASLVLSAIISEDNAGVVVAQTWNATTDHTTPASMTSKLLQPPAPRRGVQIKAGQRSADLS